jgi:hypothetical protein
VCGVDEWYDEVVERCNGEETYHVDKAEEYVQSARGANCSYGSRHDSQ